MARVQPSKSAFQFQSTLERSDNKLWGAHVRVPGSVAKRLIDGSSRRVVCSLNDSPEYQCAIVHYSRGIQVVTVNKQLREKLGLEFGMAVRVKLRKDESEFGLPMPEEFREVLQQDAAGRKFFDALTRGKQRTLLYLVNTAKSPEKRIARALTIVTHLKNNKGIINYRQLSAMLKDPRRLLS